MAAAVARANPGADVVQMQSTIDQLGLISLSRIVSGASDSISSLANELEKLPPVVAVVNGDIGFNSTFAETLKSCCMHIFRNSLDHGIGTPSQRTGVNKPPHGTLRFTCERHADHVELRIGDDGRGLALHKLYEKGVANGVFNTDERPSRDAVADLIFRSGLSTATEVTQVSGRGVGMDAVRTFLKEQGATIRIALKDPNSAELGFAQFEFLINVPATAYTH